MNIINFPSERIITAPAFIEPNGDQSQSGLKAICNKLFERSRKKLNALANDRFRQRATANDLDIPDDVQAKGLTAVSKAFERMQSASYRGACPDSRDQVGDHSQGVVCGGEIVFRWKIYKYTNADGIENKRIGLSLF